MNRSGDKYLPIVCLYPSEDAQAEIEDSLDAFCIVTTVSMECDYEGYVLKKRYRISLGDLLD